jgi:hypothetical protein
MREHQRTIMRMPLERKRWQSSKSKRLDTCTLYSGDKCAYFRVTERDVDLRDTLSIGYRLGFTMEGDSGHSRFIRKNLDLLHRRCSSLGRNTQCLEDGLLAHPSSSKGCWRRGLRLTISSLRLSEVASNKSRIPRRDRRDQL